MTTHKDLHNGEVSALQFPSKTTWLPMPTMQFPEILSAREMTSEAQGFSNLSGADLAIVHDQGPSINHSIASTAAALLMKMLVLGDLQYHLST